MAKAEPFSLSCLDCDAGMEIDSREEAILLGWTGINAYPEGVGYTHLGSCPECVMEEEADWKARQADA